MKPRLGAVFLFLAALSGTSALAQSAPPESETQISKDVLNPVTRQITLPLRYEADFLDGADQDTKEMFSLNQAVLPFLLNEDWALVTRTKMPFAAQPPKKAGQSWATGFSNGYTTFFLTPAHGSGFYWGAGPVLYYPSATSSALGVNKWGSGPSLAFLKKDEGPWVFGIVANNIWTIGGPTGSNQLLLNPIWSYNFAGGWSVGSSPNITANWLNSGGKWTLPLGGGFGKVVRLGMQPVKFDLDAYYNAIRPKAGNDTWLLQATMTLVFPR